MQPSLKRKRREEQLADEVDTMLMKNLKALDHPTVEDEEELFGRQVALILRRLPNRQRARVKLNIQAMLVDAEFPEETSLEQSYYQIP